MKRRNFIALIGGAAAVLSFGARAQPVAERRRIGVLYSLAETDGEPQSWDAAFRKRLNELGWVNGRNLQLDYRWAAGSVDRMRLFAKELIRLNPDVLVSISTPATAALKAETNVIPIVFAIVTDPIGSGLVTNLAKPGANVTGFTNIEASLTGKWLELMRDIAPSVKRVGFLFNPQTTPSSAHYDLDTFRSATSALGLEPVDLPFHGPTEIEDVVTRFGRDGSAGLIVVPETSTAVYREIIFSLATAYRLPTISGSRFYATAGGLMSYGIDEADLLRGAATYADRILRGAKPDQLPVQQPTTFKLIINLKTAKALNLDVPLQLQELADEVIE